MGKYVIVENNVGELIAIEADKAGNRIVHGTYDAYSPEYALTQHSNKVKNKQEKTGSSSTNSSDTPESLSESSIRMVILHIVHFIAIFVVNIQAYTKPSGTYFKTSSTSWEFIVNPAGIIAVLISWIVCSMIGSILRRVTMIYNNSIK